MRTEINIYIYIYIYIYKFVCVYLVQFVSLVKYNGNFLFRILGLFFLFLFFFPLVFLIISLY